MNTPDKKLKAAGQSTESLLTWLQESPKTLGWDAIVVYNRGRANALLMQQYLARLTSGNYLSPINGEITDGPDQSNQLFDIRLGVPRLSFENADIEHSKARLTLPVSSGLSLTRSEPVGGVAAIAGISRPNAAAGPKLWMDLDLISVTGSVGDVGRVVLDLKDLTNFKTNLMSTEEGNNKAAAFFRDLFTALPEAQRVFELGTINNQADSELQPVSFKVRTQAAPGAMRRAAINYGDGAVVLFVTLKGGKDGGIPTAGSDFRYLIPYEDEGTRYSGAILLSNQKLFQLLDPVLNQQVSAAHYQLEAETDSNGNPLHLYLQATTGDITWTNFVFDSTFKTGDDTHRSHMTCPSIVLKMAKAQYPGQTISAKNNALHIAWAYETKNTFNQKVNVQGGNDIETSGPIELRIDIAIDAQTVVDDKTDVIHFKNDSDASSGCSMPMPDWPEFFSFDNKTDLFEVLTDKVNDDFLNFTKNIKLPHIDTFLINNLLFPNSRSLVLKDAFVPGDLALFGNVDPSLTSFTLAPEEAVLIVGSTLLFKTEPVLTSTVTWSVQGLPGSTDDIGSVDPKTGLYTAPTRENLKKSSTQLTITATSESSDWQALSSSALISIIKTNIAVDPIFHTAQAGGKPFDLIAGSSSGAQLNWAMKDPGQGATLAPASGDAGGYTYTPGPGSAGVFTLDVVQVSDGTSGAEGMAQAEVLVIKGTLNAETRVDMNATKGQATLTLVYYNDLGEPIEADPGVVTWCLLSGTGKMEGDLYTEPESKDTGYALITGEYPLVPNIYVLRCYTVFPLPLAEYTDLNRAFQ